jgi:DNA-binding NtrC family response regulator
MRTNILIVDKTLAPGMELVDALSLPSSTVTLVDNTTQALKNIKKNIYDLIVMGDRTLDGNTYDVGLGIKDGKKNKKTVVVCVGYNQGKVARLAKLLKPYALLGDTPNRRATTHKVLAYLKSKEE